MNISGDHWINPESIAGQLASIRDAKEPISVHFASEGPSLYALGIAQTLMDFCEKTDRDPKSITLSGWCNNVETVPFSLAEHFRYSHFIWMSADYDTGMIDCQHDACRLAFFVGRRTLPRTVMMHQLWSMDSINMPRCILLSVMRNPIKIPNFGVNLDTPEEWFRHTHQDEHRAWWNSPPVDSIDGASVQDQYVQNASTNASILRFYPKFAIELVAESYCRGNAFFMTEKTMRPLVAGKPMLIYAPKNYLKRLRDMGFRTWHGFWDEGYDDFEGPERWLKIQEIVSDQLAMPDKEFWSMLRDMIDIGKHNSDHVNMLRFRHAPQ